jgi:hypothetical protein
MVLMASKLLVSRQNCPGVDVIDARVHMDEVLEAASIFMDPLTLVVCIGVGIAVKPLWRALGAIVLWTFLWGTLAHPGLGPGFGSGFGHPIVAGIVVIRILPAVLITALVFWVAYTVRKRRRNAE